jgi:hypothetical protein
VLHLSQRKKVTDDIGRCDHVAFRASGYLELKQRLDDSGVDYIERVVPGEDRGQTQIFVETPDKVTVELIFQPADVSAGS